MFDDYLRLTSAFGDKHLGTTWKDLERSRIARPWRRAVLDGHVPYADFTYAHSVLRPAFGQRGLYVWGASVGEQARIQYVGISTKLGRRFGNRYIAGPRSRSGASALYREINMAEAFAETLVRLGDDFTPLREAVDPERYHAARIPVRLNQITRLPRAERYAKVGLVNLWYYLIPAPAAVTKRELEELEGALVKVVNADLCERWSLGDPLCWPLLNIIHAQDATNPHVDADRRSSYSAWIAGAWHRDRHS